MSSNEYETEPAQPKTLLEKQYFPPWASGLALVIFVAAVAYKIITSPFNLQIDFTAVLSLTLALFAVWLSALFYFKATESSNNFYENTYRHTKDIAQLLTRIESGFGERLRHLDEGYSSMRDRFVQPPNVAAAKKEIKEEEQHIEEKIKERDQLVTELLEKTQMQSAEKEHFKSELAAKDAELKSALLELTRLRAALDDAGATSSSIPYFLKSYIAKNVIPKMGGPEMVAHVSAQRIASRFSSINDLPSGFFQDMSRWGLTDEGRDLTPKGTRMLKSIARSIPPKDEENE